MHEGGLGIVPTWHSAYCLLPVFSAYCLVHSTCTFTEMETVLTYELEAALALPLSEALRLDADGTGGGGQLM